MGLWFLWFYVREHPKAYPAYSGSGLKCFGRHVYIGQTVICAFGHCHRKWFVDVNSKRFHLLSSIILYLLVSSAVNLCKHFGPRSGPIKNISEKLILKKSADDKNA